MSSYYRWLASSCEGSLGDLLHTVTFLVNSISVIKVCNETPLRQKRVPSPAGIIMQTSFEAGQGLPTEQPNEEQLKSDRGRVSLRPHNYFPLSEKSSAEHYKIVPKGFVLFYY